MTTEHIADKRNDITQLSTQIAELAIQVAKLAVDTERKLARLEQWAANHTHQVRQP